MPIMKTMRRLFSRRTPIELSVQRKAHPRLDHQVLLEEKSPPENLKTAREGIETDLAGPAEESLAEAPTAILTRIEEAIQESRNFGSTLLESINNLPEPTNASLKKMTQRQEAIIELLRELSETERNRAFELSQKMEHVALAAMPDFQDIFVDAMTFLGPDTPVGNRSEITLMETATGGD